MTSSRTAEEAVGEAIEVAVCRHPMDGQTATYRLSDIEGLHWASESGGVGRRTAHPMVFGYVWCTAMLSGGVAHSCRHGPPPHRILVCLPKKLNAEHWRSILYRMSAVYREVGAGIEKLSSPALCAMVARFKPEPVRQAIIQLAKAGVLVTGRTIAELEQQHAAAPSAGKTVAKMATV